MLLSALFGGRVPSQFLPALVDLISLDNVLLITVRLEAS